MLETQMLLQMLLTKAPLRYKQIFKNLNLMSKVLKRSRSLLS